MRFLVRSVANRVQGDHREFDELRGELLSELRDDQFAPFWNRLSPPAAPTSRGALTARSREYLEVLSLLCVT